MDRSNKNSDKPGKTSVTTYYFEKPILTPKPQVAYPNRNEPNEQGMPLFDFFQPQQIGTKRGDREMGPGFASKGVR